MLDDPAAQHAREAARPGPGDRREPLRLRARRGARQPRRGAGRGAGHERREPEVIEAVPRVRRRLHARRGAARRAAGGPGGQPGAGALRPARATSWCTWPSTCFTPHFHFGEETHRLTPAAGVSALLGLTLHTFFDGVAIASGFLVSGQLGILLFLAVLLHKLPEGVTIASVMLAGGAEPRAGDRRRRASRRRHDPRRAADRAGRAARATRARALGRGDALRGGLEPGAGVPGASAGWLTAGGLLRRRSSASS